MPTSTAPTSNAPATLAMTTIDCTDPAAEARFWAAALGGEVAHAQDEYAMVTLGEQRIGFGRVEGWQPPPWPNESGTKQFHFDLAVEDLSRAEADLTELGATKPADQPSNDWVVLLDPAGHPFCLTLAANWG